MSEQKTAPYGRWESEITPDFLVQSSIPFDDVFVDPLNSTVYHIERRAADNGRYVIVNTKTDADVIPSPLSARTRVQGYGGAAAIAYDGAIYFSNYADNKVYRISNGAAAVPVTPGMFFEMPYANFAVHPVQTHLLVCVVEDHTIDTPQTVITTLCVINTQLKEVFPLVVGADFYAAPVFNPSGTKIAWQEWYHPDMPWEGSSIYVADVIALQETVLVRNKKHVAGERLNISVSFPSFASDTRLIFTSDVSGFQNPFIYDTHTATARPALPAPVNEDFGSPAWTLGNYPYAILGFGARAAFVAFRDGRTILYVVDLVQTTPPIQQEFPFTVADHVNLVDPLSFVFTASRSNAPGGVIRCDFQDLFVDPQYTVLKSSGSSASDYDNYISPASPMTLYRDGKPLYVIYYAPKNPNYSGPTDPNEKPPCIVNVHGGPTSMEPQVLSWFKIYFTSRGYAWLDVNYGGSSGYGREYIGRLASNWGIVDVRDCYDSPRMLASKDEPPIDGQRVAIRGGSAGGYTTLASLSIPTAPDTRYFKAATSLYGISDLVALAQDTHKFELKYMIKLLGGSVDEILDVYKERSPLNYARNITVPLLVLQGAEDTVVPPAQAEKIVQEIKDTGGEDRVKYRKFEGEGHGWRLRETIMEAVQLESVPKHSNRMTTKTQLPYGTWPSPIKPETLTADNTTFSDAIVDPITNRVYYIEVRSQDNGRCVIVDANTHKDVVPSHFNAQDAVHEYGGAPAIAYRDVIYSSNTDDRVYAIDTSDDGDKDKRYRYANFAVHPGDASDHLIAAVMEYHPDLENDKPEDVVNGLSVINTKTKAQPDILMQSTTAFYAAPVFNPSGKKMAWQQWNQPWMPFEAAFIYVADVEVNDDKIVLSNTICVAGSEGDNGGQAVAVNYPLWLSETELLYTSDESGFANPYIYSTETGNPRAVLPKPIKQDFCEPAWYLGLYPYAPLGDGVYGAFTAFEKGRNIFYVLNLKEPKPPVCVEGFPFVVAQHLRHVRHNTFVFTASTTNQPPGVVLCSFNLAESQLSVAFEYLQQASSQVTSDYISLPEPQQVPTDDGGINVVLYPPQNPDYEGLPGEKPPCITNVHGGPTAMEPQSLSLLKMYYTSRGFAWLDVNYRGSSGYGRDYIERLATQWGILDNTDCRTAVTYLDSQGVIDGSRAAVRGGSAGGYTTLCSVTLADDIAFFKAACSAYGGISNLFTLAEKTEKFELQYMWHLLGGSPTEIPDVYKQRSPLFNITDKMSTPLLMLQGENDPVVPKDQATQFADEVQQKAPNLPFCLVMYPGEGHHFTQVAHVQDAVKREHGWGGAKRHRKILRDNIQGITKPAIRRLARRGGVKRISGLIYEETRGVLKIFLENV
ncbi:hypothetical protein ID866_8232, partial [Astraeus odoratus]